MIMESNLGAKERSRKRMVPRKPPKVVYWFASAARPHLHVPGVTEGRKVCLMHFAFCLQAVWYKKQHFS